MVADLTRAELAELTRLSRKAVWAPPATRAWLQDKRINITPSTFYSGLPSVAEVEAAFEYRDPWSEMFNGGLFDAARMGTLMDALMMYAAEFAPPEHGDPGAPEGFFWRNPAFSFADAMAYYAMIRWLKPAGVVEIGSGFSTLIADQALRANGSGRLTLIEPYPKPFLRDLPTLDRLIERPVQDIPVGELTAMIEGAGLWFIDSTHAVKAGSDCLWIYLKVMPALRRDVVIHSHDVFLPYGYPKRQILDRHIYWTEQYLLYAYMLDNPRVEVMLSSAYSARALPEKTATLMQGRWPGGGGSLWYRLRSSAQS
jgi:hypothetical protein